VIRILLVEGTTRTVAGKLLAWKLFQPGYMYVYMVCPEGAYAWSFEVAELDRDSMLMAVTRSSMPMTV
jgi:hypothetical protein